MSARRLSGLAISESGAAALPPVLAGAAWLYRITDSIWPHQVWEAREQRDARRTDDACMTIPTEPIGSIPRSRKLQDAVKEFGAAADSRLDALYEEAVRDTVERFEAVGSQVVTDGEQRVPPAPRIEQPFRYACYADRCIEAAQRYAHVPVKQSVLAPSAFSMLYPADGLANYSKEEFLSDVAREHETELRRCLEKGAHVVQIDFQEARAAIETDPSGVLLNNLIEMNNRVLARFTESERARIGVHTCPRNTRERVNVDYSELLPSLFELTVGNFYIALAAEKDRVRVLGLIRDCMKADQRVFVGVISPTDPHVETAYDVRDRVIEAADYIPLEQLGTTDDCGFALPAHDSAMTREIAFAKIRARIEGTALAAEQLGR